MKLRQFPTELAETFTIVLLDREQYFLNLRTRSDNVKDLKHDKSWFYINYSIKFILDHYNNNGWLHWYMAGYKLCYQWPFYQLAIGSLEENMDEHWVYNVL